jgi:hypothetical protein
MEGPQNGEATEMKIKILATEWRGHRKRELTLRDYKRVFFFL